METEALFTVAELVMASPTNPNMITDMIPVVSISPIPITSQKQSTYCPTGKALGRPCHALFSLTVSLPDPNWLDLEEEEDWDGKRQKGKE